MLIVAPAFVAAYAATCPRVVAGERHSVECVAASRSARCPGWSGGAVLGGDRFADWFGVDRIREVFVAITEPLVDFLTFDRGCWPACRS